MNLNSSEEEQPPSILKEVLEEKGYEYKMPIGKGGTASCFLVYSPKYKMNFVCKVLELNKNTICSECELDALKKLNSSEVINCYDFANKPGFAFLFLEYCSNGSLDHILKEFGPLSGTNLVGMCKNLLSAIDYIHANRCAHLDIKPANILIDHTGRPKIADFGISRFINNPTNTTSQRAGTVLFMAPEILTSSRFDPFSADIWSLGVTFYFIATNSFPWKVSTVEDTKKAIRSGLFQFTTRFPNNQLLQIIKSMLSINPKARPTASQLMSMNFFKKVEKKDGLIQPSMLQQKAICSCGSFKKFLSSRDILSPRNFSPPPQPTVNNNISSNMNSNANSNIFDDNFNDNDNVNDDGNDNNFVIDNDNDSKKNDNAFGSAKSDEDESHFNGRNKVRFSMSDENVRASILAQGSILNNMDFVAKGQCPCSLSVKDGCNENGGFSRAGCLGAESSCPSLERLPDKITIGNMTLIGNIILKSNALKKARRSTMGSRILIQSFRTPRK